MLHHSKSHARSDVLDPTEDFRDPEPGSSAMPAENLTVCFKNMQTLHK
jgi:hypothetical protein